MVGGSSDNEGRLEVHHRSEWGTICDDAFTETDGNVACRELGFTMATHVITDGRYGAGRFCEFCSEIYRGGWLYIDVSSLPNAEMS